MKDKKVEVKKAGIDPEILDIMKQEDVLQSLSNEKDWKRVELNFACEMLGVVKEMNTAFNDMMNFLTICSADKLKSFFKELQKNVDDEENRVNLQEKMKKSHLKPKNRKNFAKNDDKVVENSKNSVK